MMFNSTPIGKFSGKVAIRQLSRWEFQLLEPLTFNDPVHGERTVPAGYISNLASIRILREIARWGGILALLAAAFTWSGLAVFFYFAGLAGLLLYALLAGYGMRAAILHDHEYDLGELPRNECDSMYYRANHYGDGTAAWRSAIFLAGVRIGGHFSYNRSKKA